MGWGGQWAGTTARHIQVSEGNDMPRYFISNGDGVGHGTIPTGQPAEMPSDEEGFIEFKVPSGLPDQSLLHTVMATVALLSPLAEAGTLLIRVDDDGTARAWPWT